MTDSLSPEDNPAIDPDGLGYVNFFNPETNDFITLTTGSSNTDIYILTASMILLAVIFVLLTPYIIFRTYPSVHHALTQKTLIGFWLRDTFWATICVLGLLTLVVFSIDMWHIHRGFSRDDPEHVYLYKLTFSNYLATMTYNFIMALVLLYIVKRKSPTECDSSEDAGSIASNEGAGSITNSSGGAGRVAHSVSANNGEDTAIATTGNSGGASNILSSESASDTRSDSSIVVSKHVSSTVNNQGDSDIVITQGASNSMRNEGASSTVSSKDANNTVNDEGAKGMVFLEDAFLLANTEDAGGSVEQESMQESNQESKYCLYMKRTLLWIAFFILACGIHLFSFHSIFMVIAFLVSPFQVFLQLLLYTSGILCCISMVIVFLESQRTNWLKTLFKLAVLVFFSAFVLLSVISINQLILRLSNNTALPDFLPQLLVALIPATLLNSLPISLLHKFRKIWKRQHSTWQLV